MTHNPHWKIHPDGMPDAERQTRSESRAASVATAMMIALMPAFGVPPRIHVEKQSETTAPA